MRTVFSVTHLKTNLYTIFRLRYLSYFYNDAMDHILLYRPGGVCTNYHLMEMTAEIPGLIKIRFPY